MRGPSKRLMKQTAQLIRAKVKYDKVGAAGFKLTERQMEKLLPAIARAISL